MFFRSSNGTGPQPGYLSHDQRTGVVFDERCRPCKVIGRERRTYMAGLVTEHMTCEDPDGLWFAYSMPVFGCQPDPAVYCSPQRREVWCTSRA